MEQNSIESAHIGLARRRSGILREIVKSPQYFPTLWILAVALSLIIGRNAAPYIGDGISEIAGKYLGSIALTGDFYLFVRLAVSFCSVDLITLAVVFAAGFTVFPAAVTTLTVALRAVVLGFSAGVLTLCTVQGIGLYQLILTSLSQILSAAAFCYLSHYQVLPKAKANLSDLHLRLFRFLVSVGIAFAAAALHMLACSVVG